MTGGGHSHSYMERHVEGEGKGVQALARVQHVSEERLVVVLLVRVYAVITIGDEEALVESGEGLLSRGAHRAVASGASGDDDACSVQWSRVHITRWRDDAGSHDQGEAKIGRGSTPYVVNK